MRIGGNILGKTSIGVVASFRLWLYDTLKVAGEFSLVAESMQAVSPVSEIVMALVHWSQSCAIADEGFNIVGRLASPL